MLSVLIIFIWMMVTTFLTGRGGIVLLRRLAGTGRGRRPDAIACAMAGIVVTTVYAQIWSLFGGVGLGAVTGLALLSAAAAVYVRYERKQEKKQENKREKKEYDEDPGKGQCKKQVDKSEEGREEVTACPGRKAKGRDHEINAGACFIGIILFLLYAYGTSRGYMHYDSDLYHAQSIRWIETYGVVPGLANLHTRLGYNSASFALSALYSFAFLGGQSYHVCAGFLAFLTALECSKILGIFRGRRPAASDFARLAGIYYLCAVFDEMVSPASDYFMVLCAFYLVIRFLSLMEEGEWDPFPYALLAMLAVYTITVKLSAVGLILLALFPVMVYIKRKAWRPILVFVGTALLISLPFLIRNVILTGWLFYPMTAIDLFAVDWKVPLGTARSDAREIKVWGRGYTDVSLYDLPMTEWVGNWFRGQASLDKIFLLLDLLMIPAALLWCVAEGIAYRKKKAERECAGKNKEKAIEEYRKERRLKLLVTATLLCSTAFWFLNAPLIRYGCVFVYLLAFVPVGMAAEYLLKKEERTTKGRRKWRCLCMAAIGLFMCYKLLATGKEQIGQFQNGYWLCQQDYNQYAVASYEIDGYTFYYPTQGDQTGYAPFPSSPVKAKIRLRGERIEDGFAAY